MARDNLECIAYALVPGSDILPTKYDQYAEAPLRVGQDTYLYGELLLVLLELADANPRKVKLAIHRRVRSNLLQFIKIIQTKKKKRTTLHKELAFQAIADAILECHGRVEVALLKTVAIHVCQNGLLTTTDWNQANELASVS